MAKLRFTHDITERRNFGKKVVNQQMEVVVDYDPSTHGIDIDSVNIYQDREMVIEISKLLDKAEGNPLTTIIEAIDWNQVYAEHRNDASDFALDIEAEEGSIIDEMHSLFGLIENHKRLNSK